MHTTYSANQWIHIGLWWDGTQACVYNNGVKITSNVVRSSSVNMSTPLYIGSDEFGNDSGPLGPNRPSIGPLRLLSYPIVLLRALSAWWKAHKTTKRLAINWPGRPRPRLAQGGTVRRRGARPALCRPGGACYC